jgi:hypothetical protein
MESGRLSDSDMDIAYDRQQSLMEGSSRGGKLLQADDNT